MTLRVCIRCKAEYQSQVPNQPVKPRAIVQARHYIARHPGQGRTAVGRSFEFYCPRCRNNGTPELRR